jgi:membrane-associated protein
MGGAHAVGEPMATVGDAILHLLDGVMSSPWLYAALFILAAVDGFLPLVPSETLAITAGVYAGTGETALVAVIAAAAGGAFAGDHVSYAIGRALGARLLERSPAGSRADALQAWARRRLAERGGSILVACRYVPGARTATTLTAGAVGHPLRSFTPFIALAGVSWGAYAALIGYLGGTAFEHSPLLGTAVGLALALALAGAIEAIRHHRRRPASAR